MLMSLVLAAAGLAAVSAQTVGCCFSFGFGAFMRPCCLDAWHIKDPKDCTTGRWEGGIVGYTEAACPTTPEKARSLLPGRTEPHSAKVLALTKPSKSDHSDVSSGAEELTAADPVLAAIAASAASAGATIAAAVSLRPLERGGCCFRFGTGAWMKPCCLHVWHVKDSVGCATGIRLGGVTGYTEVACPENADQASLILRRQPEFHSTASSVVASPGKRATWGPQVAEVREAVATVHAANASPLTSVAAAASAQAHGCCFSFGYGAFMKPCCLEAQHVNDPEDCEIGGRSGGATAYTDGPCPVTAAEAASLWRHQIVEPDSTKPGAVAALAKAQGAGSARLVQPAAAQGCCFTFGLGAFMKPCCLEALSGKGPEECTSIDRVGGRTGYTDGACPRTADEAQSIWELSVPVAPARPEDVGAAALAAKACPICAGLLAVAATVAMLARVARQRRRRTSPSAEPLLHGAE